MLISHRRRQRSPVLSDPRRVPLAQGNTHGLLVDGADRVATPQAAFAVTV